MDLALRDKTYVLRRLVRALNYCEASDEFDREEADHLNEIFRIISEEVPANYFEGFGNFRPSQSNEEG